ncbi:hypothetical protein ACIRD8_07570 [Streptomyces sp. NPDC102451]
MTAQELTNLRLGTLDTAVSDWETMHGKLDTLATGCGGGRRRHPHADRR